MKTKPKLILTIAIFFLFTVSCTKTKIAEKAEWRGEIEYENGVKVVKNPADPVYGEVLLDLEQDLSIGREYDDNYMFYRIMDIKVDEDGNIYVLEIGNLRIQKFSKNGSYLCTIGRKGQGPGEFQMPIRMVINEVEGTIGVKDMRKLIIFGKDGKHLNKDINFERYFYELLIDKNGSLWGIISIQEGDDEATANLFQSLVKINKNGQIENKIYIYPEFFSNQFYHFRQ